jgi:hypothetical protein
VNKKTGPNLHNCSEMHISENFFLLCEGNLYYGLIQPQIKLSSYDEDKKTVFDKNILLF